jgi:hypothetical protein
VVEALWPHGPYPALRVGVCPARANGCPDDPGPLRPKDLVERSRVPGVSVPDEEAGTGALGEFEQKVPGLLGHPPASGWAVDLAHTTRDEERPPGGALEQAARCGEEHPVERRNLGRETWRRRIPNSCRSTNSAASVDRSRLEAPVASSGSPARRRVNYRGDVPLFIGRSAELAQLRAVIAHGSGRRGAPV